MTGVGVGVGMGVGVGVGDGVGVGEGVGIGVGVDTTPIIRLGMLLIHPFWTSMTADDEKTMITSDKIMTRDASSGISQRLRFFFG